MRNVVFQMCRVGGVILLILLLQLSFHACSNPTYALTVTAQGNGEIQKFPMGTTVMLEAVPFEGWRFVEWQGAVNSEENPVYLKMDGDKQVTAIFEEIVAHLQVDVIGGGTVEVR